MMSSVCPVPRGLQSTGQTTLHWSSSSNRYSSTTTSIANNTNARHSWTPVRSASTGISTTALHSWAASRNSISSSPSMTGGITINTSPGMTTPVGRRSWSPVHRPRSAPGYNNGHHRLSAPAVPSIETEEEYVEFYQQRILTAQQRQLLPLQEDLADWLNKLLDTNDVTAENFMDALDDGTVVCRLARYVQQEAQQAVEENRAVGPVPKLGGRIWQKAARRSFFSRDNTENFIRFCRQLGVHENLIFESDDLVMHSAPRSVVLCLLEVSRLAASRFGLEASGLVQLEREIAECASPGDGSGASPIPGSCGAALSDSGLSAASLISWRPASPPPPPLQEDTKMRHCSSSSALSLGSPGSSGRWSRPGSADDDEMNDAWRAPGPGEAVDDPDAWRPPGTTTSSVHEGSPARDVEEDTRSTTSSVSPRNNEQRGLSDLDRKVEQAARAAQRQCRCSTSSENGESGGKCDKLKVRRLGAGKYNIAGRNVFVRLLKGRHMMVRVGGGWDTLEHFLERHDPCQARLLGRGDIAATPSPRGLAGPARRQSSPGTTSEGFLRIRDKYRNPPPARS